MIENIDDYRLKFNERVMELQEKKGKNSRMLTKENYVKTVEWLKMLGVYSRNQFEPLPEPLLAINQVNKDTEIPLRTAANKQSQGGGQGFIKCNCNRTCQANNCRCKKNNQFCNSRCHKASKMCLNQK